MPAVGFVSGSASSAPVRSWSLAWLYRPSVSRGSLWRDNSWAALMFRAKPLGLVLYEGPSLINGQPIAVIATGFQRRTANSKTGDMVQTWILRSDMNPLEAIHTGNDVSICGNCPLRGMLDKQQRRTVNRRRACYVNVHQTPLAVYRAYRRGRYEQFHSAQHLALFQGRMLRLGSYGDPVAAPYRIWLPLVRAPMVERVTRTNGRTVDSGVSVRSSWPA